MAAPDQRRVTMPVEAQGEHFAGAGEGGIEYPSGGRAGTPATGGSDARAGEGGDRAAGAGTGGAPDDGGAPSSAGAGTGGEAGVPAPPGPDTDPPYVVEVSPPDGALGVRADAEIVITFSEPMHRVETEKAYGSLDLPTKDVTFLWSNGDRTLTIHPDDGLEYGVPPAGPGAGAPRTYAYLIASEARDAAGNRLEEDFTASFTTLREYWRVLPVDQATLITRSKQGTDGYMAACGEEETSAVIGEFAWPGKVPVLQGRGLLVNFELLGRDQPDVPDDVLSATLSFENVLENISLGPLLVERVRESASLVTWDTPVLETLTSTKTGDIRTADVRPGVLDQFERGVNLIQFFIHYELMLIDDDIVQSSVVTCGKSHIEVKFLGR